MTRTFLKGTWERDRSYSRAVTVTGGKTVYLAGVGSPFDENHNSLAGDFEAQAHGCFAALKQAMEDCGGKLSDITTMTVFITDIRYGDAFVKIRSEYFENEEYPGSALIGVESLAKSEMMVEIQAIGVIED